MATPTGPLLETRVENGKVIYTNHGRPISKSDYDTAKKIMQDIKDQTGDFAPEKLNRALGAPTNNSQTARPPSSDQATRLGSKNDPRSNQYVPPKVGYNVLRDYRSYTYNFTLAAITTSQLKSLSGMKISDLSNVILTSKGKGPTSFTNVTPDELAERAGNLRAQANKHWNTIKSATGLPDATLQTADEPWRQKESAAVKAQTEVIVTRVNNDSLVAGFSKSSSGRFDMFIDDVEIQSVIGKNSESATSTAFHFSFNIIEPYSVFGFIDAILVAAQSAGYNDYAVANYVLAVDFIGYPDTGAVPSPKPIPRSTRLFPIKIYEVVNTINERGTVYACKAIPAGDAAVGTTVGQLKTDITATGKTVKDQAKDLEKQLNDFSEQDAKANGRSIWDKYRIEFPAILDAGPGVGENSIASSEIVADASSKPMDTPEGKPGETTAFSKNKAVTAAIDDIIKKSKYWYDEVKTDSNNKEEKKQVNFWTIIPSIEQGDYTDPLTNRKSSIHIYKVVKYKTSPHRVTGNENNLQKYSELVELTTRNYDYIYTGQNTEVLDFKINFNLAWFSGIAPGNSATKSTNGYENQNGTNPTVPSSGGTPSDPANMPNASVSTSAAAAESRKNTSNDPDLWAQTISNVYQNIINAPQAQFQGEITILGDPYFLVSANGIMVPGNQKQGQEASNGEATALVGEVYITINFYNPTDIDTTIGLLDIDTTSPVPFSGIFSVYNVTSEFKNGVFKQVLFYTRVPTDRASNAISTKSALIEKKNPNDQKVSDAAPASATQATDENGVVTTASAQEDKPPIAPSLTTVALTQNGAFSAGGNLVTKEQISLAELKALPGNLQSAITGPIDALTASVNSQLAAVQGSVSTLQNGIATGLTAEVAKVTGPISNSPLVTFINSSNRGLA